MELPSLLPVPFRNLPENVALVDFPEGSLPYGFLLVFPVLPLDLILDLPVLVVREPVLLVLLLLLTLLALLHSLIIQMLTNVAKLVSVLDIAGDTGKRIRAFLQGIEKWPFPLKPALPIGARARDAGAQAYRRAR